MTTARECMAAARAIACANSEDPKTFVGALIAIKSGEDEYTVVSSGVNRFPPGTPNINVTDKEAKNRYIIHAEVDAIVRAIGCGLAWGQPPLVCFVTHAPCANCARTLRMAGVDTVYYGQVHSGSDLSIMEELGMNASLLGFPGIEPIQDIVDEPVEAPAEEAPAEEAPAEEAPAEEAPAEEAPEAPAEEAPADEAPAEEAPEAPAEEPDPEAPAEEAPEAQAEEPAP
jgi:deoxycytidylate deaminase